MSPGPKSVSCALAILFVAAGCLTPYLPAQDQPVRSRPWTLEEALAQLQWYPRDPYLQYVALQLARRKEGTSLTEVTSKIEQLQRRRTFWSRSERVDRVDLFNIFSGALAIQESLQLDTMRAGAPGENPIGGQAANPENRQPQDAGEPDKKINVRELTGPTIKSHPWAEMLGNRRPEISPLAYCVPADFYFIELRSVRKLLEAMDEGDLWGQHLLSQSSRAARTQQVGERIRKQLAIETNRLFRPFYDLVVTEAAITGSDLFIREGSDVTVLFRFQQPEVFKKQMEQYLSQAAETNPGSRRTTGEVQGISFDHLSTPDRSVQVYAAYPQPDLHVRTNSRVALERVIAAIQGKNTDGQPVQRLGDSTEFAYIRCLMPRGAAEEDGFAYLSDPFIRRMVGPELKLTERRRMICYNHLRMIGHASMMHRTEQGKPAQALAELERSKCTPGSFGQGSLACPDGGRYSLSTDGISGVCSHHGHAECLIPCCEIPVAEVTAAEAELYRQFLDAYNQYWRTFFDPIAIRVQMTPRQYRVETLVLPLIDNSIYTGLARATGGAVEPLDSLPVPKRNIFSLAMHVDKRELLAQAGLESVLDERGSRPQDADSTISPRRGGPFGLSLEGIERLQLGELLTKGVGNQVGLHVYDAEPMFAFNLPSFLGQVVGSFQSRGSMELDNVLAISMLISSLNSPVYVSIPVQDPAVVDLFLGRLDAYLAVALQQEDWGFFDTKTELYRLRLKDQLPARGLAVEFGPVKWRFFWARIGNGLYVASQPAVLEDLLAMHSDNSHQHSTAAAETEAHALIRIRPQNWQRVLSSYQLGWAENNRESCLQNLGPLSHVCRAVSGPSDGDRKEQTEHVHQLAARVYGTQFYCPDAGQYLLSRDGRQVTCTVHGSQEAPQQRSMPSPESPVGRQLAQFSNLTVALTFLEDGLRAVMTVERKSE